MKQQIKTLIQEAIKKLYPSVEVEFTVDHPPSGIDADFASNAALVLAKKLGKKPMAVAEEIRNVIASEAKQSRSKKIASSPSAPRNDSFAVEAIAPGFLNFKLPTAAWQQELARVLKAGKSYGSSKINKGKKARVEYVSANPTGPIHIGNVRGGPYGEVICKVLVAIGYKVLREYIHNDIGGQVEKLGRTLWYWYQKSQGRQAEFPEGGYQGEYLVEVVEAAAKKNSKKLKSPDQLLKFALSYIFAENLEVLEKLGIKFDLVVKESELKSSGKTDEAVAEMKQLGLAKDKEGALWFAPPPLNSPLAKGGKEGWVDREAVIVKSNGETTYFASDIAYHKEKFTSGYDLVIDIFGSNHHGHVPKLRALTKIFDFDPAKFMVLLYQYVRVKRGEQLVKMSKRAGNYVTAKEVLEEVGKDSMVFTLLATAINTHVDFDLELAKDTSEKNPVYRVQYAHARISSILRKAPPHLSSPTRGEELKEGAEIALIRELAKFPELVQEIAENYSVHHLPHYLLGLADKFHQFYEKVRVITDNQNETVARLALVKAVQQVLANGLELMGIKPMERM